MLYLATQAAFRVALPAFVLGRFLVSAATTSGSSKFFNFDFGEVAASEYAIDIVGLGAVQVGALSLFFVLCSLGGLLVSCMRVANWFAGGWGQPDFGFMSCCDRRT